MCMHTCALGLGAHTHTHYAPVLLLLLLRTGGTFTRRASTILRCASNFCAAGSIINKTIAETQQELQNYYDLTLFLFSLSPKRVDFHFLRSSAMLLFQWVKVNALTFSLFLGIFYICMCVSCRRQRWNKTVPLLTLLHVYLAPLLGALVERKKHFTPWLVCFESE